MHILLIEDNPADVRLVREAMAESAIAAELHWVSCGEDALGFLKRGAGFLIQKHAFRCGRLSLS